MLRRPSKVAIARPIGIALTSVLALVGLVIVGWHSVRPIAAQLASRDWVRGSCDVTNLDIRTTYNSEGDPSTHVDFDYVLTVGAERYPGTRIDFLGRHNESYEPEDYPEPGERIACWYDPADPRDNVILREGGAGVLGAAGIAFVLAALLILHFLLPRRAKRTVRSDGRCIVEMRNGRTWFVVYVGATTLLCDAFAIASSLWSTSILNHLVWYPFAIVLSLWSLYLVCAFTTRVQVSLAREELRGGDRLDAKLTIAGVVKPTHTEAKLVGRERSIWQEGSNRRIDIRKFHERDLEEGRIPKSGPPSVESGPNTIEWRIDVRADIPLWPDVELEIPIVVRGSPRKTPRDSDDEIAILPKGTALGIRIDGGRSHFAPGDTIAATLGWESRHAPPTVAVVRLVWHTRGSGTDHHEVAGEVKVAELPRLVVPDSKDPYRGAAPTEEPGQSLAATDLRRIRFVAPDAPYSYDGTYVHVWWTLELVVNDQSEVVDLVIDNASD